MSESSGAVPASMPSAIAAGCGLVAFVLLRHGVELMVAFCALGGCGEPENDALGWGLILLGLVTLATGIVLATKLSNSDRSTSRALLALPAVVVIGFSTLAISLPDHGAWGQGISLYALVLVFVGVLVPPRDWRWGMAAAAGATTAAVLAGSTAVGVVGGTAAFLAGLAASDMRGALVHAR